MRTLIRICKELAGERKMLLTGLGCLIFMQTFILFRQAMEWRKNICFYDAFALLSNIAGNSLIPLGTLFLILLLREDFRYDRLLRLQKMPVIWLNGCVKLMLASILFAFVETVWCGIMGKLTVFCKHFFLKNAD